MGQFSGRRYINLESYKKDGEPKLTPVQSLEHDGQIYVRTDPSTWKVKRIRRNPHVRVVPSDRNGKPAGSWAEGEARLLDGDERDRILKVFRKEYGAVGYWTVGFVGRLRGERQMSAFISITLQPEI
ncbi:MAG: PPOX class F420-dependent oxidoreductase [Thaumarchaeota archaeon]|nr:PPOX class F420-dependent oxidoreductase [Nitrososphaerota archaeon]